MKSNFDGIRMVTVTVGEVERYNLFDVLRLYVTKVQGHDARRRRDFFPILIPSLIKILCF